jgi:Xaa-Pro aminopeptidase
VTDDVAAARRARLAAVMARHEVGAVLLATPHLGAFASGARRVQVAGSGGSLPWVVVRAGEPPVVFTPDPDGAGGALAEPLCWDRERQLDRIAALVGDVRGRIACDVVAPALAARLGRELVDAAPLLAEAVAPRSRAEVAAIEAALATARAALRAAVAAATPGVAVARLVGAFTGAMAPAGFPLGEGRVWRNGTRLDAADVLADGDVVACEMGLVRDGHAGVAGDTLAIGGAALAEERRAWFTALCALAKRCRAGAVSADLCAAARTADAGQQGLLAHGLGVGVEPPWIDLAAGDATPLRAGTVLVLAPVVGAFRATRALLVSDDSPRWLEAAP